MKKITRYTAMLTCLLCSLPAFAVENSSGQQQQKESKSAAQVKTYTSHSTKKSQLSRKCGIYSGICPMGKPLEVGAYCICHTPSGPIHGVVVP
ncbi:MAG: hypothetical protein AAES65_22830 [Candidatus Thiodiazotropha sp. (ex. Lucinoma kazani)]|nr:hypothetical protein [Candidatus Thiodiazotropha sp. (ex Lucinoma borealis)]MCU7876424.1 hypothetical protein [Candidatus Thiodiazotropha sp. (ex Lucinoma borealis)]